MKKWPAFYFTLIICCFIACQAVYAGVTYDGGPFTLAENGEFMFELHADEPGDYPMQLDFYIPGHQLQNLELAVSVNGAFPGEEYQSIKLPSVWRDAAQEGYSTDRYGNQIYPASQRVFRPQTAFLNNTLYNSKTPLLFPLQAGTNTITIQNNEVAVEIENITFTGRPEIPSYEAYRSALPSVNPSVAHPIILEGESYDEKSDSHIRGERSKNYNLYPYDVNQNRINHLAETMWAKPGESVTYNFNVEEDGVYHIAFKYMQTLKYNMPVYKNILIDGEPAFDECLDYGFAFTNGAAENHILNKNGENFGFYLTAGPHTLTVESTASVYAGAYEDILARLQEMNGLAMDILMITGGRADTNRDWNIEEYLPDIKTRLTALSQGLMADYNTLCAISGSETVAALSNLRVVSNELLQYTVDRGNSRGLDRLINNLDHFSQGGGSMTEMVSKVITDLLDQPMGIDRIYITPDAGEIPPAQVGIFTAFTEEVKKLFASFAPADTGFSIDKKKLNVWVNRPITHIETLREMISSHFTESEGVEVNLSAMPDESKLMLSIVAGSPPDAVIGLSMTRPFDLGLRGALYDLRQFEDFPEAMQPFTADMFVPFVVDDKCYALPETANFFVLFYRTDIMERLDLPVPRTWDDVIKIMPSLNRYGMNIQTIISGADAFKHFGCTVPFIQQYEGTLYSEDGSQVAFNDPNTLEAFTMMTDLYTKYSLPTRIVNFYYNFKSGVTPLGISELGNYILLKNAAPEIYGQWKIAPNIGVETEDGRFLNTQPDVASACVILEQSKMKDTAWQFLRWWMDSETQYQYGTDLQSRFGRIFMWNTANLETLSRYTYFDREEKEVIIQQIKAAQEIPRHPAYFQVERELSNAWTKVITSDVSAREALEQGALTSNRVIATKMAEFGYMDEMGNVIRPFESSTADNIQQWMEE